MSDPSFQQSERRRAAPLFVAAAVLAAVAILIFYLNPHDTAAVTVSNTHAVATRTNFKSNSIVVGAQSGQDDLYVLTNVRIEDHLRLPITIDTMLLTFVTADGQQTTTSAATREDLPAIFMAFPQLKPLTAAPLLRETAIEPKQSAEGQVVFHLPVTQQVWDARRSATVEIDLYHQNPQTVAIPK